VQQFLIDESIPVITQPPYPPDLAPRDFLLFTTLKMGLKGTRFAAIEDIKSKSTANSGRFQKKPSLGAFNSDRIDGTSACARMGLTLKMIR
jgi:hypothetical protein